jgi:hypothetical protein
MIFNYFIFNYVHFILYQLLSVVSLYTETHDMLNINRIRLKAAELCERLSSLFGGWKIINLVLLRVIKLITLKIISKMMKYSGFITVTYKQQITC